MDTALKINELIIVTVMVGTDCRVAWLNGEALRSLGYANSDLEGQPLSLLFSDEVARQIQIGTTPAEASVCLWHKSGAPLEHYAVFDFFETKQAIFCLALLKNKKECDLAQDRLCAEQTLVELVLDAGEIGLWTWDSQAERMEISDSWFDMTGQDAETVRQMLRRLSLSELSQNEQIKHLISWWAELVHPDDVPLARQRIERYLLLRMDSEYQNLYRFRHGDERWITIRDQGRAEWKNDRLSQLFIAGSEVTELAETERELRRQLAELKADQAQARSLQQATEAAIALIEGRVGSLSKVVAVLGPIAAAVLGLMTQSGQDTIKNLYESLREPESSLSQSVQVTVSKYLR